MLKCGIKVILYFDRKNEVCRVARHHCRYNLIKERKVGLSNPIKNQNTC